LTGWHIPLLKEGWRRRYRRRRGGPSIYQFRYADHPCRAD